MEKKNIDIRISFRYCQVVLGMRIPSEMQAEGLLKLIGAKKLAVYDGFLEETLEDYRDSGGVEGSETYSIVSSNPDKTSDLIYSYNRQEKKGNK